MLAMSIRKSTPHVVANEGLIFERSSPGRTGYSLPPLDVPAPELALALGAENVRPLIEEFPELSEMDVVRHFTRLSSWNYSMIQGYPLGPVR
jgi:glycine dehydrogenase subunit 2